MVQPRTTRSARGYSLIELMIATSIGLVIVAGALALLNGQMRAFQTGSADRALQETARIALSQISGTLRHAGYGVDPALVFDFGDLAAARMQASPLGSTFAAQGADCDAGAALCRDHTDGPDELSFLARDAMFGPHVLTAAPSGTTLKMSGPLREPLYSGQLLQVICYTGSYRWAYVTVDATVPATADAEVEVNVVAGTTDFPHQVSALADPCYGSVGTVDTTLATHPQVTAESMEGAAKVFKVDRYRYFVRSYSEGGAEVPWGTAGSRPFLMLHQGLSSNGRPIESVIAPDVEDLQVAYVFPLAAANQVVGTTAATPIPADATGIDLAATAPLFSDTPANKATHHPGNIRAVQVGVVVRSMLPDLELEDDELLPLFNRPAIDPDDQRRRLSIQTSVAVPNLGAETPFYPPYDIVAAAQGNAGGG